LRIYYEFNNIFTGLPPKIVGDKKQVIQE